MTSAMNGAATSAMKVAGGRLISHPHPPAPASSPSQISKIQELNAKLADKTQEADGRHRRVGQGLNEMRSVTRMFEALLVRDAELPELDIDEDRRSDPTLSHFKEKLTLLARRFRAMEDNELATTEGPARGLIKAHNLCMAAERWQRGPKRPSHTVTDDLRTRAHPPII